MRYLPNSSQLEIIALKSVKPDEQLFACYLDDPAAARASRQQELLKFYLFECCCTKCIAEGQTVETTLEPAEPCSSTELGLAVQLLDDLKSSATEKDANQLLPLVLTRANSVSLRAVANEAVLAMINFEMVSTDLFQGHSWDKVRRFEALGECLLVAAAISGYAIILCI